MKNNHLTHLLLAGLLVILAINACQPRGAVNAITPAAAQDSCDPARSVQVTGTAVVNVTPDRVLLRLGVQSNGTTPTAVRDDNERQIGQVVQAVKRLGIDSRDIATDHYLVYPVYSSYSDLVIKGYRIDNTVSITLRNAGQADDVLVAALRAGANEVLDVQFYTSELRKYRDQARDLAMRAAGEKAHALAGSAGAQTGCLLSASENVWTYYSGGWRGGREGALWTQNVMQNVPAAEAPVLDDSPLSPGQIAIQAQVSASYSIH